MELKGQVILDKESMDECKAHSGQAVPDLADAALTIVGDWGWLH